MEDHLHKKYDSNAWSNRVPSARNPSSFVRVSVIYDVEYSALLTHLRTVTKDEMEYSSLHPLSRVEVQARGDRQ